MCVCVCVREREGGERETDRQTDRQTDREMHVKRGTRPDVGSLSVLWLRRLNSDFLAHTLTLKAIPQPLPS